MLVNNNRIIRLLKVVLWKTAVIHFPVYVYMFYLFTHFTTYTHFIFHVYIYLLIFLRKIIVSSKCLREESHIDHIDVKMLHILGSYLF